MLRRKTKDRESIVLPAVPHVSLERDLYGAIGQSINQSYNQSGSSASSPSGLQLDNQIDEPLNSASSEYQASPSNGSSSYYQSPHHSDALKAMTAIPEMEDEFGHSMTPSNNSSVRHNRRSSMELIESFTGMKIAPAWSPVSQSAGLLSQPNGKSDPSGSRVNQSSNSPMEPPKLLSGAIVQPIDHAVKTIPFVNQQPSNSFSQPPARHSSASVDQAIITPPIQPPNPPMKRPLSMPSPPPPPSSKPMSKPISQSSNQTIEPPLAPLFDHRSIAQPTLPPIHHSNSQSLAHAVSSFPAPPIVPAQSVDRSNNESEQKSHIEVTSHAAKATPPDFSALRQSINQSISQSIKQAPVRKSSNPFDDNDLSVSQPVVEPSITKPVSQPAYDELEGMPVSNSFGRSSTPPVTPPFRHNVAQTSKHTSNQSVNQLVGHSHNQTIVTALHAWSASAEDQLTFQPNDQFHLVDSSHPHWLKVRIIKQLNNQSMQEGLVPRNYVRIEPPNDQPGNSSSNPQINQSIIQSIPLPRKPSLPSPPSLPSMNQPANRSPPPSAADRVSSMPVMKPVHPPHPPQNQSINPPLSSTPSMGEPEAPPSYAEAVNQPLGQANRPPLPRPPSMPQPMKPFEPPVKPFSSGQSSQSIDRTASLPLNRPINQSIHRTAPPAMFRPPPPPSQNRAISQTAQPQRRISDNPFDDDVIGGSFTPPNSSNHPSNHQPVIQPPKQPASQSFNQPAAQSFNQPAAQSFNQSVNASIEQPAKFAIARHDYQATNFDQLSLLKNEVIRLIDCSNASWYMAEKIDQPIDRSHDQPIEQYIDHAVSQPRQIRTKGLVPITFIKVLDRSDQSVNSSTHSNTHPNGNHHRSHSTHPAGPRINPPVNPPNGRPPPPSMSQPPTPPTHHLNRQSMHQSNAQIPPSSVRQPAFPAPPVAPRASMSAPSSPHMRYR